MRRIFTAADISEEARTQCGDYVQNLQLEFADLRVGWYQPEKLHLTLKFLGDIDEVRLQDLSEVVAATARRFSNFNLRIAGTGAFPPVKRAQVLWLGAAGDTESLMMLNKLLESECEKRGFAKEHRNFNPHLTIARLREAHKSARLVEKHLQTDFESSEFTISGVTIYESVLHESGSIYAVASKYKFDKD